MGQELEIMELPEQFKFDVLKLEKNDDLFETFKSFNDTTQKLLVEYFNHPDKTGKEIAKICGITNVWVSEVLNKPKVKNFIARIRLEAIADVVDTNMVKAQDRITKLLDSDNEKIVLEAVKVASTLFAKNLTDKIDNNTGSMSPSGI